jgi:hypothetical protein
MRMQATDWKKIPANHIGKRTSKWMYKEISKLNSLKNPIRVPGTLEAQTEGYSKLKDSWAT